MEPMLPTTCTAFADHDLIASGDVMTVARAVKPLLDAKDPRQIHIVDDATSQPVEIDFRGTVDDVVSKLAEKIAASVPGTVAHRGPGRPKLGVVGREVTLLPRHWEWLSVQPGGASVTLRKLVDEARRTRKGEDTVRSAQDVTYRFMTAVAGDLPGYEEATRAVYGADEQRFAAIVESWPAGVREHASRLSAPVWSRTD